MCGHVLAMVFPMEDRVACGGQSATSRHLCSSTFEIGSLATSSSYGLWALYSPGCTSHCYRHFGIIDPCSILSWLFTWVLRKSNSVNRLCNQVPLTMEISSQFSWLILTTPYTLLYICGYVVCVQVPICMCARGSHRLMSSVFHICFPLCCLRQGLPLNLGQIASQ